jgi:hypothetical protein
MCSIVLAVKSFIVQAPVTQGQWYKCLIASTTLINNITKSVCGQEAKITGLRLVYVGEVCWWKCQRQWQMGDRLCTCLGHLCRRNRVRIIYIYCCAVQGGQGKYIVCLSSVTVADFVVLNLANENTALVMKKCIIILTSDGEVMNALEK